MIDTHCHLFKEYYDEIEEVITISEKLKINEFI